MLARAVGLVWSDNTQCKIGSTMAGTDIWGKQSLSPSNTTPCVPFFLLLKIVITGASDGIGKEFASQLASKKLNIVLVSRTESKLKVLAEELGMWPFSANGRHVPLYFFLNWLRQPPN